MGAAASPTARSQSVAGAHQISTSVEMLLRRTHRTTVCNFATTYGKAFKSAECFLPNTTGARKPPYLELYTTRVTTVLSTRTTVFFWTIGRQRDSHMPLFRGRQAASVAPFKSPEDEHLPRQSEESDFGGYETPSSIHHAITAGAFVRQGKPIAQVGLLLLSASIVTLQIMALTAIFTGVSRPTCSTSDDCPISGMYCLTGRYGKYCGRCTQAMLPLAAICCSGDKFDIGQTDMCAPAIATAGEDPRNGPPYCAACSGGSLLQDELKVRMNQIRPMDTVVIIITLIVVIAAIAAEARDVHVCGLLRIQLTNGRYHDLMSLNAGFAVVECVRLGICLPFVFLTVPELIAFRGQDAVNVCMNTVAVLFVLELDDIIYAQILDESTRSHYEEKHVIVLSKRDAKWLKGSRVIYMVLTFVSVIVELQAYQGKIGMVMGGLSQGVLRFDRLIILGVCSTWSVVDLMMPELSRKKYGPVAIASLLVGGALALCGLDYAILQSLDGLD